MGFYDEKKRFYAEIDSILTKGSGEISKKHLKYEVSRKYGFGETLINSVLSYHEDLGNVQVDGDKIFLGNGKGGKREKSDKKK